jgi:Flp pilus assembly protein TadG
VSCFGRRKETGTPRQRDDRGQVTAFVVVIVAALILCAGLVIDGGLALAARVRAQDEAQSASRTGAEQINLATYRASGTVVLDQAQAVSAAEGYLGATGDRGQVSVNGDVVTVTVEATQPTQILGIVGLHSLSVSATASATAVRGITGAGQ